MALSFHRPSSFSFPVTGDEDSTVSKDDLIAAGNTSKEVIRDLKKAKQGRKIVWKEVLELGLLGHGVQIKHDWVPGTPIAFVQGFEWTKSPKCPATVKVLKLVHSFPIRVKRTTRSGRHEETLAQNSPAIWESVSGCAVERVGSPNTTASTTACFSPHG
jgi:hypothetical protein